MNYLIKEGREKLKGVSDAPWTIGDTTTSEDKGYEKDFPTYSLDLPIDDAIHKTHYSCIELYSCEEDRDFIEWSRDNLEAILKGWQEDKDKLEELKRREDLTRTKWKELYIVSIENAEEVIEQQKQIVKLQKVIEVAKASHFNAILNKDGNYVVAGKDIYFLGIALIELEINNGR